MWSFHQLPDQVWTLFLAVNGQEMMAQQMNLSPELVKALAEARDHLALAHDELKRAIKLHEKEDY